MSTVCSSAARDGLLPRAAIGMVERVRRSAPDRNWGVIIFGLASTGLGVIGLLRGDFTIVWHPVPDLLQGQAWLAYLCALLFTLAGAGLQRNDLRPGAASILCLLYMLFAISWLRRVIGYPLIMGTWLGFSEQFALALGAAVTIVIAGKGSGAAVSACRICFGLCELVFGLAHFLSLAETRAMTPAWLPPGQDFWAVTTGVAHLLAGLALILGIKPQLAARLLAVMFFGFGALVWMPLVFADPLSAFPWSGSAINLALVGAAWALADLLARQSSGHRAAAAGP